jgi:hypothetical protein
MVTNPNTETVKLALKLINRFANGEATADQLAATVAARGSTALAARVAQCLIMTGKINAAAVFAEHLETLDPI